MNECGETVQWFWQSLTCAERNLFQCPQIPHGLAWNWTRNSAMGGRWPVARIISRPCNILKNMCCSKRKHYLRLSVQLFSVYQRADVGVTINEERKNYVSAWEGTVIIGCPSLRHGASSVCGWRNDLQYGG